MQPDIVERLRNSRLGTRPGSAWNVCAEAADEIERLQQTITDEGREIERLRGLLAETVPDPEYRRMQDAEIERLRAENAYFKERNDSLAVVFDQLKTDNAKARSDALEEAAKVAETIDIPNNLMPQSAIGVAIRALKGNET